MPYDVDMPKQDKKLERLLDSERSRQKKTINLTASENIAPAGVLKYLGSVLTNKYAEGYPRKRYYPGCKVYDEIELLAQDRALKAFGLSAGWSVNVQAYSGAIANMAIYMGLLNPGDTILAMDLSSGGHLSHGSKASMTSKLFSFIHYGVDAQYKIDYKKLEELAKKHKPKLIVSGASAYPNKIDFKKIGSIAKKVGAYHLADISHYAGLVVAGAYPSPFLYADVVMTTTHKSLMGPRGALIFSRSEEIAKKIDRAIFPGLQGGPHMNTIAAIAHGLLLVQKAAFKTYAKQVVKNAKALANELQRFGFKIVGGGTQSHMLLINVSERGITGREAEERLEKSGILANRNTIAGDASPQVPSAIRLGTYWVTTWGMKEKDMKCVAKKIIQVLD